MSEVVENIFTVEEGEEISVATGWHDWATAWTVDEIDHVEWRGIMDEPVFATREVGLETPQGSAYSLRAVDDAEEVQLIDSAGQTKGFLEEFAPFEHETHVCEGCGDEFDSLRGLTSHQNNPYTDCGDDDESEDSADEPDAPVDVFETLKLGDKVDITTSWYDYASRLYVKAVDDTPSEPLPSGDVPDRLLTITTGHGSPDYDLVVEDDAIVVFSEASVRKNQYYAGEGYRKVGHVEELEKDGQVSLSKLTTLRGLADQDASPSDGDDSWQKYYRDEQGESA